MILDRYVLRLWVAPFVGGLVLATGVLLLGRAIKLLALITDSGAPWSLLGLLLLNVLPYFALLTVPIAFFLSVQHVISGLQQGSEMDAMRAAGLSYLRIFRQLFVVAILLYLLLGWMAMFLLPQGQLAFNNLLRQVYSLRGAPDFTPRRFSRDMGPITFYVDGKDAQGRYHGVMVEDARPGGPVFYLAETAELTPAASGIRLRMHHGTRLEGRGDDQRILAFKDYEVVFPLGRMDAVKLARSSDHVILMTPMGLWQRLRMHPDAAAEAEWHWRLMLPTTILILTLFALPLSLTPKRSGRAGSYILGVALLVLLYNVQFVLHRQADSGAIPGWSMWLGQGGFFATGIWLWLRAEQDRMPFWLQQGGEFFYSMHQRLLHWFAHRLGRT